MKRTGAVDPQVEEHELSAGFVGVVEPRVAHEIERLGAVRFFIEFPRRLDNDEV